MTPEILDRAALAARLRVQPHTITIYLARGWVPAPDGRIGRSPYWLVATIDAWEPTRPGRGAGGGRPRKRPAVG